jgi:Ca2+-binding EF-hand superfamily protein
MGQAESHNEIDLEQIQELCMAFMKECPSGALHLHELKRIFGIPASCEEETLYIETVFHSFDTNRVSEGGKTIFNQEIMFKKM